MTIDSLTEVDRSILKNVPSAYIETPEKFRVGIVKLCEVKDEFQTEIREVMFPDNDGQQTAIPFVTQTGSTGFELDWFEKQNRLDLLTLSSQQRSTFSGLLEHNFPLLLALHVTSNNTDLLEEHDIKKVGLSFPSLWSVSGFSDTKKSTLVTTLALKFGFPIINFDTFSENTSEGYLKYLKSKGLDKDSPLGLIEDMVAEFISTGEKQTPKKLSMREVLDSVTERFVKNEFSNHPVILCDFPSAKMESSRKRPADIFDVAREYSTDYVIKMESPDSKWDIAKVVETVPNLLFWSRRSSAKMYEALENSLRG